MRFWQRVLVNGILFVALTGFFQNSGNFYVSNIWIALAASLVLAILMLACDQFYKLFRYQSRY